MKDDSPVSRATARNRATAGGRAVTACAPVGAARTCAAGRVFLSTKIHTDREEHVQQARGEKRAGQPDLGDQHEAARQHAHDRPDAVEEIQQRKTRAGKPGIEPQDSARHQRERGAEQHRLRKDEQPREHPLGPAPALRGAHGRKQVRVGPVRRAHERPVEEDRAQSHREFRRGVGQQRAGNARGKVSGQPRAEREPADEHDEHHRLRVGGVAQEELEVVAPDGFVDEPAEAGNREQAVEDADAKAHGYISELRSVRRK